MAVAGTVLLLAVALVVDIRTRQDVESEANAVAPQFDHVDTEMEAFATLAGTVDAEASRPVYKYSVVAGGAYTIDELTSAIRNDAVVAAHYENLDQSRLRTEVVPHDRYVHVSYRKGDDVFWTSKKVLLRKGETILTDGTTQVRARCGNCISEQPVTPTAADEPDAVEFDRLVAGTPSSERPPAGMVVSPVPPIFSLADPLAAWPGSPVPFGSGGLSPSGGVGGPHAAGTASPAGEREPGSPGSLDLPGSLDPPGSPWSPGNDPWPEAPFDVAPTFPGGPVDPLGPTVIDPAEIPPTDPINPVPVPEPGTLLLVGGGVAALVRKFRSRRQ